MCAQKEIKKKVVPKLDSNSVPSAYEPKALPGELKGVAAEVWPSIHVAID